MGPGLHLAADWAGEVVCGAQVIHVTVQARVVAVALGSPGPRLRAGGLFVMLESGRWSRTCTPPHCRLNSIQSIVLIRNEDCSTNADRLVPLSK